MRRLTPAGVSTMMVVVVGLLVTAYFAKLMRAEDSRGPGSPSASTVEFRAVPTAAGSLEPGTVITSAHLSTTRVRVDGLAPDVLLQEQSVLGRTVKQRIAAGSSLRASQLYPPGEGPQPVVARGMRAVSIPVPRGLATMNGLVKTGQYVDVYLTPRADAGGDSRFRNGLTLTLFRGVRLLSVAPDAAADEASSAVTLELTPEQATVLILAREKGSLALSYNPEGKGESGVALKNRDRATLRRNPGGDFVRRPEPPGSVRHRPSATDGHHHHRSLQRDRPLDAAVRRHHQSRRDPRDRDADQHVEQRAPLDAKNARATDAKSKSAESRLVESRSGTHGHPPRSREHQLIRHFVLEGHSHP